MTLLSGDGRPCSRTAPGAHPGKSIEYRVCGGRSESARHSRRAGRAVHPPCAGSVGGGRGRSLASAPVAIRPGLAARRRLIPKEVQGCADSFYSRGITALSLGLAAGVWARAEGHVVGTSRATC